MILVFAQTEHIDQNAGRFQYSDAALEENQFPESITLQAGNITVYDMYANNSSLNLMISDQKNKWRRYAGLGKGYLFVLSWTTTLTTVEENVAVRISPDISIITGALKTNIALSIELHKQIDMKEWPIPNIVLIDSVDYTPCRQIISYNGFNRLKASTIVAETNKRNQNVEAFCIGENNLLYHNYYDADGWNDWLNLGGAAAKSICAVTNPMNQNVEVFHIGMDDIVYHNYCDADGWHDWVDRWGAAAKSICAVTNPMNQNVEVFHIGMDDIVYHNYCDADGWHPYGNAPEGSAGKSICAAYNTSTKRVEVYLIGMDDQIYYSYIDENGMQSFAVVWQEYKAKMISAASFKKGVAVGFVRLDQEAVILTYRDAPEDAYIEPLKEWSKEENMREIEWIGMTDYSEWFNPEPGNFYYVVCKNGETYWGGTTYTGPGVLYAFEGQYKASIRSVVRHKFSTDWRYERKPALTHIYAIGKGGEIYKGRFKGKSGVTDFGVGMTWEIDEEQQAMSKGLSIQDVQQASEELKQKYYELIK